MPDIILKNVTKRFGSAAPAVDQLNLHIKDKEFISLLGPSGCGKTTTLRMIAGLESPTEGEIYIDDKLVFSSEKNIDLSPAKRDVGFLFQSYALWPHMTVYKNIVFGLENMKWNKNEINDRVEELTTLLKIEKYLERYPSELSGGQQQRVAIARTLAPRPKVLFMDEPLSNLDAKLRMDMRSELKRIHLETDSTFVYVTHDQLEAMTLSSRICTFSEGKLQQYAAPLELYNNPANIFVADFVGNPTMNFVDVTCQAIDEGYITIGNTSFRARFYPEDRKNGAYAVGKELVLGIRPEHIEISPHISIPGTGDERSIPPGNLDGIVYSSLPSGLETVFKIQLNEITLTSIAFGGIDYAPNTSVKLQLNSDKYVLFDKQSGTNLSRGRIEMAPVNG